ncbi:Calx-beta domain-containing protein, partial [Dapis sp. BLCC M126]|uniref:Calx-beta domain-containing protein n=1 Tax=Dapis sp. BLCC M126 TaxID=3400189 RepID=UPI003CEBD3EB
GPDTFTYTIDDGNGGTDTATVTVNVNAPLPSFAFTNPTYSINEDGTPAGDSIQIQRSGDTSGIASVQVQLTDVTATGAPTPFTDTTLGTQDFDNTTPITVTFSPAQTLVNVPVNINNDTAVEPIEELNLNLVIDPTTGTFENPATAALQIIDDDVAPVVPNISINDVIVNEGDGNAIFTVTLDPPSNQTINLNYSTSDGTAETTDDYIGTTFSTLPIPAGQSIATIEVPIVDDNVPNEGEETFNVNLTSASSGNIVDGQGMGRIIDNDVIQTGSISGTVFNDLNNNDFPEPSEGIGNITVFIDSDNDNIPDPNERNTLTDSNGNYNFSELEANTYNIRAVPQANFIPELIAPVPLLAGENATINIQNNISPGRISGTKFNDMNGDGAFDPGEPGIPGVTIYLDLDNDGELDSNEPSQTTDSLGDYSFNNLSPNTYFVREVVPLGSMATLTPSQLIITPQGENFTNIDFGNTAANAPGISITQTGDSTDVTEGLTEGDTYEIVLNSRPAAAVNIAIITSDGQTLLSDSGETPSNTINLTFDSANALIPQTITVTAVDDNIAEPAPQISNIIHTVSSTDQNYNGLTVPFTVDGTPSSVITANITDDDRPNVVITPTTTEATEGGATGSYQVFLTTQPIGNVSINFNTDQQIQPIEPITFDQTNWNVPRTVAVTAVEDNIPETETQNIGTIAHTVFSQNDPNYNNLNISQVTVNIDDPEIPEPTQVLINQTDGNTVFTAGGSDNYTIELNSNPTTPIEIAIAPPPEINLGSGIGVPITLEFNESNGTTPQNVTVTGVNNGNFNIFHSATLDGIDPNLQFFVDGVPTNIVNANVTALPFGNISGTVFNDINRNGSLDLGETGLPNVTVFLDTNPNDTPDSNEQQTVTNEFGIYSFFDLSPDNYTVRTISPPNATLTTAAEFPVFLSSAQNVDNTNFGYRFPNPGTLQFSNPIFSFTEGTPNAIVTVTRTGSSDGIVSADINLTDGTANRGSDFGDSVPETIFFADGETQQTVSIPIFNDELDENTETANLNLANVTGGANIGQPATATLEIIDDPIIRPPLTIQTQELGFEEFNNFDRFGSIVVDSSQGSFNLGFSSNTVALDSRNIPGGEGRFNVNPTINNTVIAHDTGNAIRIDLRDIIEQVGGIGSGSSLIFDYASPNRSHTVTFFGNNQQLEPSGFLDQTRGELNDFSNFIRENIPIPGGTQFIEIGSQATELGIDNLQLILQTEGF